MLSGAGLTILSAMITPAVLISACGTLILSTSNRLGRASDRVRRFLDRIRVLANATADDKDAHSERVLIMNLLPQVIRRVRLIHRSLAAFYLAVGIFVLTSVVIGGSGIFGLNSGPMPIILGLIGAIVLCYGAVLLTIEAQLSLDVNMAEMNFILELGTHYAPPSAAAAHKPRTFGRWRRTNRASSEDTTHTHPDHK